MIGAISAGASAAASPRGLLNANTIFGNGTEAKIAPWQATNKTVFHGRIEVLQVANGYVVNIGRREGYEYETYIASSATEVNEIIAAQIVAFRLEERS